METLMTADTVTALYTSMHEGIAHIRIDLRDSKVNKLNAALMQAFERLLDALASDPAVQGVVISSGKPGTFVAGADIDEIQALTDSAQAAEKARFGQRVFDKIEHLGKPVVAAIHGACLGGGCEMILACHHRIASDDSATRIGLPEVRLGIIPGFGGTQRLPRVVGLQAALDMILSGKVLDARRALRAGLVDQITYPQLLEQEAVRAARRLHESARFSAARSSRRKLLSLPGFLDRTRWGRNLVLRTAVQRVRKQTQGHYPAPLAAIESVRNGLRSGGRSYEREAELLGQMAMTPVSRHLIQIFRLTEANKRIGGDLPPASEIRQIGIIGAGVMGGGIAHLAAYRDVRVRMKDLGPEQLLTAFRTARDLMRKAVRSGKMDRFTLDNKMASITASLDYTGFSLADVVIEAVVENMDVKKKVLREIEAHLKEDAVLASNTSALSISEMAEALEDPGRLVGMHFFNPVHRMPLVEIVTGERTSPRSVAMVLALARRMGKTPVIVKDGPGFLVNRILAPYMNESSILFEEGQEIEVLEKLMRGFGMPMGPFELIDEVGTDVAHKVGRILHEQLGERMRPAKLAEALQASGRLGRKSGLGVFRYEGPGGRRRKADPSYWRSLLPQDVHVSRLPDDIVVDRVFGLMVNEAARCLDERIVATPEDLDLALIFGIGFPPFRGGLLRWADGRGIAELVARLRLLEQQFGARFAPCEHLIRMAESGGRFFDSREFAPVAAANHG